MCGRYQMANELRDIAVTFDADVASDAPWHPSWNIRPTDRAPVLLGADHRRLGLMSWGWQVDWAKRPLINARTDKLTTSRLWRPALEHRRCLVPATGWWEWRRSNGHKTPYHHQHRDLDLWCFAGLWQRDDEDTARYTILVTEAASPIAHIHDRMPVILTGDAMTRWLHPGSDVDELADLCSPTETVTCHPVEPFALGADSPDLIDEA